MVVDCTRRLKVLEIFRQFDRNGDGLIDRDDLGSVLKALDTHMWNSHELFLLFEAMGRLKDDKISFDELIDWAWNDLDVGPNAIPRGKVIVQSKDEGKLSDDELRKFCSELSDEQRNFVLQCLQAGGTKSTDVSTVLAQNVVEAYGTERADALSKDDFHQLLLSVAGPLIGTESSKVILDDSITCSSCHENLPVLESRFDCKKGWGPKEQKVGEWIQFDFAGVRKVMSVQTKGGGSRPHWVTNYQMSYSMDNVTWNTLVTTFKGNNDPHTLHTNKLSPPIIARSVRLMPTSWEEYPSLRVELQGVDAAAEHLDFCKLDSNADGLIALDELEQLTRALPAEALTKLCIRRREELSQAVLETLRLLRLEVWRRLLELQGEQEMLMEYSGLVSADARLSAQCKELQAAYKERIKYLLAEDVDRTMAEVPSMPSRALRELKCQILSKLKSLRDAPLLNKLTLFDQAVGQSKDPTISSALRARSIEVSRSIYSKGFSLGQLLDFVDEKVHKKGQIGNMTTTAEVVSNIIIPETAERGCCYADIFPGGPKNPETLMSHWWGNNFLHLVKAICQHAAGKMELFKHMYSPQELEKTYWLCIFAVNQHRSICHRRGCRCESSKHLCGITCQMNKFAQVMQNIPNHALAMDLHLVTLKRVWVLSELDEAMHGRVIKKTMFCGVVDNEMRDEPKVPTLEDAECSFPEDKERIVGAIMKQDGGAARFDKTIQKLVGDEIAALRSFWLAESGETEKLKEELGKRPFLLTRPNAQGRGEHLLHITVRYGLEKTVKMLLEGRADPNAETAMKWTALHYVGLCFNPATSKAIMWMLLEAEADANAKNNFGRTALEEAVCGDPDGDGSDGDIATIPEVLMQLTDQSDIPMNRLVLENSLENALEQAEFRPHPLDARLFSHWDGLRVDSWDRAGMPVGIMPPVNKEIQILSHWVKPTEFGSAPEEVLPLRHRSVYIIFAAAKRVEGYIKYRWKLWDFDTIVFLYCGSGYKVNLNSKEVRQISGELTQMTGMRLNDKFSVITFVPRSIRSLYP